MGDRNGPEHANTLDDLIRLHNQINVKVKS